MGRSAIQYDRSQNRRAQKQRSMPEDYDEDISELGQSDQSGEAADEHDCECDSDASECHCDLEDKEDKQSEKTCDGSDAEVYYELKENRRNRKRELLVESQEKEKAKQMEKEMEDEVNAAYQAFNNDETIPFDFTVSRSYRLYSTDHFEWMYDSSYCPTNRVDFHYIDESGAEAPSPKDGSEKPLYGDIYLDEDAYCNFGPIPIPKQTRRKDMKIMGGSAKYDLKFKFFRNEYLKLSVPRALVELSRKLPSHAPERFEFVGILRDREKERGERKKAAEEEKKNRPASPHESYFEMNHPMGSWAQSRW